MSPYIKQPMSVLDEPGEEYEFKNFINSRHPEKVTVITPP
jgi:hypothetical protein